MILDTNALSAWADGNPACRDAFLLAASIVVPTIFDLVPNLTRIPFG